MMSHIKNIAVTIMSVIVATCCHATQDTISLFPLENYNQDIAAWIKPSDADYNKPMISADIQRKHLAIFTDRYYGVNSPWNAAYVNNILQQPSPDSVKAIEQSIIDDFSNQGKPTNQVGYGENFRPYSEKWITDIANNINIAQFDGLIYKPTHRGIAIDNLHARALPTEDVHFYSYQLAGQGYPFDNLQISALWAGTPVYIVGETRDKAWMLVLTPDYIGWVKNKGIAKVDSAFVSTWTQAANHSLAAITKTQTSVIDENGKFQFSAYVGSVFPANTTSSGIRLLIPVADAKQHAVIKKAFVMHKEAVLMPLTSTPHHFVTIMKTLIGRTYGWGNMYFYNDCSAELKNLMTPFGIWLPRHSSEQVKAGNMVDMSYASADKRLSYLMENGQAFVTLIYIGGHIVLYVGNYPNPQNSSSLMAMTYQNIWGLSPKTTDQRAVIGKAVLFPMLLEYPEDTSLTSLAAKKYFQVSYLNQSPNTPLLMQPKGADLKSLMHAETP